MWDLAGIGQVIADALAERERMLAVEQAPLGIDARDELELQPIVAKALANTSHGVLREQRYPAGSGRLRRSEGARCDFVLTPEPGQFLRDPLLSGTLFANEGIEPCDALWLEMKVVAQHSLIEGIARANPSYSSLLLGDVCADVRKLSEDSQIAHAAVVIVLFTEDAIVAQHDLGEWLRIALNRSLAVSRPLAFEFPIRNTIGNAACTIAVIEVHRF